MKEVVILCLLLPALTACTPRHLVVRYENAVREAASQDHQCPRERIRVVATKKVRNFTEVSTVKACGKNLRYAKIQGCLKDVTDRTPSELESLAEDNDRWVVKCMYSATCPKTPPEGCDPEKL